MSVFRHQMRRASALSNRLWRGVSADVAFWLAKGDTVPCIRETIAGRGPLSDKVCVFVHYDGGGVLRAHARRYLDALTAEGFCIVFVSNSPLCAESLAHLTGRCVRILLRDNRGYDFAAYRDGIFSLDMGADRPAIVVLANDSVYGPVSPLSALFDGMDFAAADVWGVTDSWQTRYHLQSYLVAFGPTALANPRFAAFWRQVRNVRSKWAVVRHYEIGMTQAMQAGGLRCAAVFDYQNLMRRAEAILDAAAEEDAPPRHSLGALMLHAAERAEHAARMRIAMNPVIDMWLMLAEAGGPFIKRELLRDDPTRLHDLVAWHRIVQSRAPALYREMIEDLKRVMRRAAP
ncbi:rhamnan synthesis F family protein [Humitalea sp. 24SJ18S-53]|uniref:rhamnan synthesis F family protein n=1 Tax=Humitalea sp. 24SJ18S-53 TaxID=3422307 RepID=UPI003D672799